MRLLKNEAAFKRWKSKCTCTGDTVERPKEFPCYVIMIVESYAYEADQAIYYYRDELAAMLAKM